MSNTLGRSSYFCFSMDLPHDEAAQEVAQQFAGQLGWNAGSGNATVVVLVEDIRPEIMVIDGNEDEQVTDSVRVEEREVLAEAG